MQEAADRLILGERKWKKTSVLWSGSSSSSTPRARSSLTTNLSESNISRSRSSRAGSRTCRIHQDHRNDARRFSRHPVDSRGNDRRRRQCCGTLHHERHPWRALLRCSAYWKENRGAGDELLSLVQRTDHRRTLAARLVGIVATSPLFADATILG